MPKFLNTMLALLALIGLPGCGILVQQGVGDRLAIPFELNGAWRVRADGVADDKTLQIAASGDSMRLTWSDAPEKTVTAYLYHYGDTDYAVIDNNPQAPLAIALKVVKLDASGVTLQVLNNERVEALLQEMAITPQRRVNTWSTDIVLDGPTLQKLLDRHDAALFYQASVITMSKVTAQ